MLDILCVVKPGDLRASLVWVAVRVVVPACRRFDILSQDLSSVPQGLGAQRRGREQYYAGDLRASCVQTQCGPGD